ncbi:MAG: hypothetical protein IKP66_02260, partial [Lachnospiraceae bacterium]|nr:hypothetical protein [Lachnospiraceae bacterium]
FNQIRSIVGEPIVIDTTYGTNDGLKIRFDISKYMTIKDRIQVCRYDNGQLIPVYNTYISNTNLHSDVYDGEYVLIDVDVLLQGVNIFN